MCLLLSPENYTNFSHSRCKLKVLIWYKKEYEEDEDEEDEEGVLCGIWTGSHEGLPEFMTQNRPKKIIPECEVKKELKMTTAFYLMEGRLEDSATYLLQWVQQRKDSIHLCCRKLQINGLTRATFQETFKIVNASCIVEIVLSRICIEDLAFLNPYLRQMKNIFSLTLHHITGTFDIGNAENQDEEKVFRLISQLPTLHYLQKLYVNDVSFITGNLKECLR